MPSYAIVRQRTSSYGRAASLLPKLQQVYRQCREIDDAITLYQSGVDSDFRDATNSIFSVSERQELTAMLNNIKTLVDVWTAQHSNLLNFDEQV